MFDKIRIPMDKIKKMRPKNPEISNLAPLSVPETSDSAKAAPDLIPDPASDESPESAPDPTRYGDWQVKGRCIDF